VDYRVCSQFLILELKPDYTGEKNLGTLWAKVAISHSVKCLAFMYRYLHYLLVTCYTNGTSMLHATPTLTMLNPMGTLSETDS
jgi:hypothetical protein